MDDHIKLKVKKDVCILCWTYSVKDTIVSLFSLPGVNPNSIQFQI